MSSPEDERYDEDVEPFEMQVQGETEQEGDESEFEEQEDQYTTNSPDAGEDPVLHNVETNEEASYALSESDDMDFISDDRNAEEVMSVIDDYTEDEEVLADFEERQHLSSGGGQQMHDRLREHHAETPDLSGGDVDAAWDQSEVGDHLVSTEPTPDRDIVDEIGEGAGLTYDDDEPLDFEKKVWTRDRERWELNPESAEDELDRDERDEED